jgi:hypothetical protein
MNRRNFLGMMVGGVAAAAAIRTFPFRVFSFPKEIHVEPLLSLHGLPYWNDMPHTTGTMYSITRYGVFEYDNAPDGWVKISQELDIEEAKRMFPAPFRWQDGPRIRQSVLLPDGSVTDA